MTKKYSAQHWYQVHKSRAGSSSVELSMEVANAREKVSDLQFQIAGLKVSSTGNLASSIRRLFLGRNTHEELLYQSEQSLSSAELDLETAIAKARTNGERAYAAEWRSKNPDKVK